MSAVDSRHMSQKHSTEPTIKAFQFIAGKPQAPRQLHHDDKENKPHPVPSQKKAAPPQSAHPSQQDTLHSPSKAFPSTPATRLPLSDLLGNGEDRNAPAVDISPEEQISWNSIRSPRSSASKKTPAPRKKRARSSSPPSTSQRKSTRKDTLNLDTWKNNLKTPKIDPAADLWNRYAVHTDKDRLSGINTAAFANLTYPSSPYSADVTSGNVAGLRRWTSCGIEWPSSKAKRRKVNHTSIIREQVAEALNEDSAGDIPGNTPENTKPSKSKITSLIERIQGSLNKPREPEEPKAPSSSSPLPETKESLSQRLESPVSPSKDARRYSPHPSQEAPASPQTTKKDESSSSFGGDDMDLVDICIDPEKSDIHDQPVIIKLTTPSDAVATQMAPNPDDDEFDNDIDITADDFQLVASLCDTRSQLPQPSAKVEDTRSQRGLRVRVMPSNDFGDDDFDDDSFAAAEAAATQTTGTGASKGAYSTANKRIIQRYLVQTVCDGSYTASNGRKCPEKILLVEDDKTKLNKIITLRQSWFDTRCAKGSFVHVIGEFDCRGQCIIDDAENLLILHPDQLISALVVADSFTCMRRSVLQDRIKATSEASAPMVYGTMLHEVFQEAMQANRWDTEWLESTIQSLVVRHVENLYKIKLPIEQAVEHLLSKMPGLQSWAEVFVRATPQPDATVKDRNGKQVTMSVNKLLDVEEHVWSPMYGLKGNIDSTVQVTMQDDDGERTLTVPVEVKTGKNSSNASHRAQTALYTLLLSDRYDIEIAYGVLYYLESSEISRIPAIRHELRHMIMQRNELACYVRERLSLPPMVRNTHQCGRCYAKTSCFIYHKLAEDGDGETSGLRDKFDAVVRDLGPTHQTFFKKWDDLLTKEESEMMKFKRELWTMLSEDREKHGRCFAKVVLDEASVSEKPGATKINRFRYTFRKQHLDPAFSFNESQIAIGEPIVVSDEKGHYALAMGYVVQLARYHIAVAVDRRLRNARIRQPGFDPKNNQTFSGIMEVEGMASIKPSKPSTPINPVVYRIDKDEFSNGLASVRNNLIQLMNNEVFRARELRGLIVDGVEPRFKPGGTSYDLSGPLSQLNINEDQREAIDKIMSAEDYALVLGMPGTGKTTTIAHIIRALVAKGKSVLLTSYTHTAVDNILLKLRHDNIGILRLGASAKVHPEVRDFVRLGAEPSTSIEELEKLYHEPQVVATTCLGINHQIFQERLFDYCIVDEASQITLPVCLGPVRMAKTFILVGDHYQLPPLVQNREAQEGGLDVSLFKLLSEEHPAAVTTLRTQYRMNDSIMSVSNNLIYEGRLVCGSESVARSRMTLPNFDALASLHHSTPTAGTIACPSHQSPTCWIRQTLHHTSTPVVFINTDTVLPTSRDISKGARVTNPFEASLATQIIQALLLTGLDPTNIGLITLYRSQLALIKSLLQVSITPTQNELLEAHTTDRFQGRDKDIIVMSCVRNNKNNIVGDLLKDWRRVNVAVTRAKKKLIIVGSKETLSRGDLLLAKLIKLCEDNAWMVDLPTSAADGTEHRRPVVPASLPTPTSKNQTASAATSHAKATVKTEPGVQSSSSVNSSRPQQRQPLQPRSTNLGAGNVNKAFKVPSKVGRVAANVILSSGEGGARGGERGGGRSVRDKRSVVKDIFNDILGEVP